MTLLPASAEPAANAGTGPEGHKRSSSADSGTSSDSTLVAADDVDSIDSTIDGSHKSVATGKLRTSPPEPSHERAASDPELVFHDAKRGRVSTDTASGAPALATHTMTAGSSTVAAPITVSIYTATALAVADPNANALDEPNEASDTGQHEAAPERSTPAAAASDATANGPEPEVVIDPGTPVPAGVPASSAIDGLSTLHDRNPTPVSASTTTGAASAPGAAASESATIDANPTSRGDVGCPETPVISRPRSHVVAGAVPIRAFSIGRTSTPAPAPGALLAALLASATALHGSGATASLATVNHSGLASPAPAADAEKLNTLDAGSKSAVIVANATSRVHANCPRTPVVSRLPAPRSHVIPGTAVPAVPVNGGQFNAFCIGRRSAAASTAPPAASPTPVTTAANPPAPAPTPALPPMPATALSPMQPQSSPARFRLLRTVSRVIQRGMGAIRDALIALYTDGIGSTNGERSRSPGPSDEDRWWDERDDARWDLDAPVDTALLELRKRLHRRIL